MRALLLCLAAPVAAMALFPASASGSSQSNFSKFSSRDSEFPDGRHHGRFDGAVFGGPWVAEGWAVYNNRSWDPDSYNDWWHDRPDRAYPRWVQHNENCTPDRMWWSGSGWHC